jgi:adenylylsulfate kinase-like enzyme
LNKDLGFTDADRIENIRRAGQVEVILFQVNFQPSAQTRT